MPIKYFRSTDTTVELKDTMKLQKASLDLFGRGLGYFWDIDVGNYKVTFLAEETKVKGMLNVSLNRMQLWHNHEFVTEAESFPYHGEDILPEVANRLGFMAAAMQLAINNKLVHRTNLQYSKKRKELICVDHQISFK